MIALTQKLGSSGEEAAVRYLQSRGNRILERNVRSVIGEIDIVAKKGGTVSFIEVKTRIEDKKSVYRPEDNITYQKQEKLKRLGEHYLLINNFAEDTPWQIDVITVSIDPKTQKETIRHLEQAVTD